MRTRILDGVDGRPAQRVESNKWTPGRQAGLALLLHEDGKPTEEIAELLGLPFAVAVARVNLGKLLAAQRHNRSVIGDAASAQMACASAPDTTA